MKEIDDIAPKPLIELNGKTLLERSLESLDFEAGDSLIIVTQRSHRVRELWQDFYQSKYPHIEIRWLELDKFSRGQLETAVWAESLIDPKKSLAVFNCDTYFKSAELKHAMQSQAVEGIIPCAIVDGDSWSFCATTAESRVVTKVAEKKRISNWCSVGFYYFKDASLFFKMSKESLKSSQHEYYVAPLYNQYIEQGFRIEIVNAEIFKPMGTPQQVRDYWAA